MKSETSAVIDRRTSSGRRRLERWLRHLQERDAERHESEGNEHEPVSIFRIHAVAVAPAHVTADLDDARAPKVDRALVVGHHVADGAVFVDPTAPAAVAATQHRTPRLDRAQ